MIPYIDNGTSYILNDEAAHWLLRAVFERATFYANLVGDFDGGLAIRKAVNDVVARTENHAKYCTAACQFLQKIKNKEGLDAPDISPNARMKLFATCVIQLRTELRPIYNVKTVTEVTIEYLGNEL